MFIALQVLTTLASTVILYWNLKKQQMEKKKNYIFSFLMLVSACISTTLVEQIALPSDIVTITALKEKNESSSDYQIEMIEYISSGDKGTIQKFTDGIWLQENKRTLWITDLDKRIDQWFTRAIKFELPVGLDRTISFVKSPESGKFTLNVNGETETYDLYSEKEGIREIKIESTGRMELYYIKALRFGGWLCLFYLLSAGLAYLYHKQVKIKNSKTPAFYWGILAALSFLTIQSEIGTFSNVYSIYIYNISLRIWIIVGISLLFNRNFTKKNQLDSSCKVEVATK